LHNFQSTLSNFSKFSAMLLFFKTYFLDLGGYVNFWHYKFVYYVIVCSLKKYENIIMK
jgi:hypothetical protein